MQLQRLNKPWLARINSGLSSFAQDCRDIADTFHEMGLAEGFDGIFIDYFSASWKYFTELSMDLANNAIYKYVV